MLQPGFAPVLQSTMIAPQFQQAINQSAYPIFLQDNSFIQLMSTKQFSESMPMFNLQIPVANRSFDQVCADSSLTFCPSQLGLIPSSIWSSDIISFGSLVQNFFRRRNSSASKFPYKLFNALRITEVQPEYFPHIGVKWVDDNIIWVNREAFASLIGVKTIEGGLFHQQGNFPSHRFIELSYEESEAVAALHKLGHVDLSHMRMVRHSGGVFKRGCTESDLEKCKWKDA
ncbi:hypothetical protein TVAG_183600 [Trichomonas vaginalis G3]|uniref:Initiator binding domain-containing protein n=1 Tax=Trichomonas vaginalis (strain ATCC PRA-98 / G3) TaxID=412133 RepID=A2D997_TRIV3|nr:transcription-initiator DNA-binding domain ibd family [Trichomonas vaginalis G3]EAY23123.1 hypothetical protein TVAG_183600 [Trichomonas vaginalis G3]KAI5513824.1 transcription-initiator DNA-binding domain ibd family [Trichomonas vaginalis G3]|eukprot:XP_001584109.1 hypothetical protein [Trichomonas vaginalis G3]